MAKITGYVVSDDGTMTAIYDGVAVEEVEVGQHGPDPVTPVDPTPAYGELSKKQLEDEVSLRNAERKPDDVDYIVVDAPGNKAELVAALEADDQVEG